MITVRRNPRRWRHLVNKHRKLSRVAEELGISGRLASKEFKRWCEMHGLDPGKFYIRGTVYTGFWVPDEFVDWLKHRHRVSA